MSLTETFQVTYGTAAGRRHRDPKLLVNNQDAVLLTTKPNWILGTLSDGCGSQPHSEFGSSLTVNLLSRLIRGHLATGGKLDEKSLDQIYQELRDGLYLTAGLQLTYDDLNKALEEYMLATAGGVLLDPEWLTFIGAGDFILGVNDEVIIWEPNKGNNPQYPVSHPDGEFRVYRFPTKDVERFFMATDGGVELRKVCNDPEEYYPGTEIPVGSFDQIWTTDDFYTDDTALTSWLSRVATTVEIPGKWPHGGLVADDVSLVAGRRI